MKQISPTDAIGPATDFARYFAANSKPASLWAAGPEVEFFGFTRVGLDRINFDQVQTVIEGFSSKTISQEKENGHLMGATLSLGTGEEKAETSGRLTLEPGGQIEFSCAARNSLADVERGVLDFTSSLGEIGRQQDIVFVAAGFDPLRRLDEQKWIPKRRYEIMRPYLNTRGDRAWDMMCRTAAIQVNMDYGNLEDLAKKFTLANRLAPVAAAIFANSPFLEGKLSGYKSLRYLAWLETDPDRTGPSPVALEDDFSMGRFLDHIAQVPMFFIRRDGQYIDLAGESFAQFIRNGNGQQPIFQDFTDHLSTIFTEARLKPYIEQRSMDCGPVETVMAALAFWKGLMYDERSLEAALALMPKLKLDEFTGLQLEVARHGLQARVGRKPVIELAEEAIELARAGLEAIAPDEARYLDLLEQQVIRERICPADILIRNFRGSWNGDMRKAIEYLQIGQI